VFHISISNQPAHEVLRTQGLEMRFEARDVLVRPQNLVWDRALVWNRRVHHLARAMVLLDASAIARNVSRDLVFPASRRAACSHSDLDSCKPRSRA